MKVFQKLLALTVASALTCSLAACSSGSGGGSFCPCRQGNNSGVEHNPERRADKPDGNESQ